MADRRIAVSRARHIGTSYRIDISTGIVPGAVTDVNLWST